MAQLGGLARRATAVRRLRAQGDLSLLAHNGGVVEGPGWQQELKLETALAAMQEIGYAAMNVGVGEAAMGIDYLRSQSQAHQVPLLAGNLLWGGGTLGAGIEYWRQDGAVVGIVGMMSEAQAREAQAYREELTWDDPVTRADEIAREAAADHLVLLYHGSSDDAMALAREVQDFAVVVAQTPPGEDGTAGLVTSVGDTRIVTPGAKGQHLLTLALRGGEALTLPMSDAYADDAAVGALMELYHVMVEEVGASALGSATASGPDTRPRPSDGALFVGSDECGQCHANAYAIWQGTKHAHAYDTLVSQGRAHDPECLVCHVTGLGATTGFTTVEDAPALAAVGCETCHGAGSAHVGAPEEPYPTAQDCGSCHTTDASPRFERDTYWRAILHGSEAPQ